MATETPTTPETTDSYAALAEGYAESREAETAELLAELEGGESDEGRSPEPAEPAKEAPDATAEATPATTPEIPADGAEGVDADAEALLAKATPFTYTVNGEARTVDGIRELPDGAGAIINPDALPMVRDLIQKGQSAWDANRELYQENQRYAGLEYTDLNRQTAKGLDAFQAALVDNARLRVIADMLAQAIEKPETIVSLATDPTQVQLLQERLGIAAERASNAAQKQWGERIATHSANAETAPERLTPLLSQHIDSLKQYAPSLTEADWQEAKTVFGPFAAQIVRRATPDDAHAAGVKVGSLVVDNSRMMGWLEQRSALRQQEATAKAQAEKAQKENAARLAAANAGKKQPPAAISRQPAAPQAPTESDSDRKAREYQEWYAERMRGYRGL